MKSEQQPQVAPNIKLADKNSLCSIQNIVTTRNTKVTVHIATALQSLRKVEPHEGMDKGEEVKVVAADRLNGSVILTFSDGRSAMYSSQLLHAMLHSAHELHESDLEAEANQGK